MSFIRLALVVSPLVFAAAVGCNKPSRSNAAPSPAPVTTAAPPAMPATVATRGKMAHCPSIVTGAATAIDDVPGGVAITVTAGDPAATAEIRDRSSFLVASTKNDAAAVSHNGTGEGGGIFGRCPVVMRNTTVTDAEVTGGAKVIVVARDPREESFIRREARSRLAELGSPAAAGAGTGKMAHCPNAVHGAATSIADGRGAIVVKVTATDDGAVKEIRDRARQIVLASQKSEVGTIKHDGSGDGGGGFGRCPIVLKDTAIAETDAPGGAVFTVKPKDAKNLPALAQQVRERTARFD
jgi:TusA-related sulfurtransferase